jgi:hypothetical protein
MRCKACDAEMILLNVVQYTMAAPGFKYDTFMCSECHDIVRRLVTTAVPLSLVLAAINLKPVATEWRSVDNFG